MSRPDPADLSSLMAHLSAYGECYLAELDRPAKLWLAPLIEAGWVQRLDDQSYAVTQAYLALPADLPDLERRRRICFAVPAYRRYLIAVLAEGLVRAGQVDYHDDLERWITNDLAAAAAEINALLDELEAGEGRMVEWQPERVAQQFRRWHARHEPFIIWDRPLLGLSGAPEQLFTAVLSRADALHRPKPASTASDRPLALLPDFSLPKDDAGRLILPTPEPRWIARRSVHSSVPLFAMDGRPAFDRSQPVSMAWQDALAQQPYYRAVLRTAMAMRFSGYGPGALALFVPNDLARVQIRRSDQTVGPLAELLPTLVEGMGYRAGSRPSPDRAGRILEHWMEVGAMELRDGQIRLQEGYAQTLHERRRATLLLRGQAREEQKRVENTLKRYK